MIVHANVSFTWIRIAYVSVNFSDICIVVEYFKTY